MTAARFLLQLTNRRTTSDWTIFTFTEPTSKVAATLKDFDKFKGNIAGWLLSKPNLKKEFIFSTGVLLRKETKNKENRDSHYLQRIKLIVPDAKLPSSLDTLTRNLTKKSHEKPTQITDKYFEYAIYLYFFCKVDTDLENIGLALDQLLFGKSEDEKPIVYEYRFEHQLERKQFDYSNSQYKTVVPNAGFSPPALAASSPGPKIYPIDTGEYTLRQSEYIPYIEELISDYESHGIEKEITKEFGRSDSGYWLLTAGPGMGKSTILASISQQKSAASNCITYFFREDFDGSPRNRINSFQNYIMTDISQIFPSIPIEYDVDKSFSSILFSHLHKLSGLGLVSRDKPLFIFVDALDEMDIGDLEKSKGTNPLNFPDILCEGVFVLCTLRQNPESDEQMAHILPRGHRKILLDGNQHEQIQKDTIRRYIHRICKKYRFIKPYWGDNEAEKKGPAQQDDFVRWLANQAGHNFMILRCVLHDQSYWRGGGTGINIVDNLEDFYETQFWRMAEKKKLRHDYSAIFCLAIQPSLYVSTFHQLIDQNKSKKKSQNHKKILNNWINQGLVIQDDQYSYPRIRAYHSTFREYLHKEFWKQNYDDVLKPFLANLVAGLLQEKALNKINDGERKIYAEWLFVALNMGLRAGRFGTLSELLRSPHVWDNSLWCPEGSATIIKHISCFTVSEQDKNSADAFMRVVANCLVKTEWTSTPSAELGRVLRLPDIVNQAGHSRNEITSPDSLDLISYIKKAQEQLRVERR